MTTYRYPDADELYALERAARRARAAHVGSLFADAAGALRSLVARGVAALAGGFRHA